MNTFVEDMWPDEVSTLQTLAAAAVQTGGTLQVADAMWRLYLPGAEAQKVRVTGSIPFPLALGQRPVVALCAGEDVDAMAGALGYWLASGASRLKPAQLGDDPPDGWEIIPNDDHCADLVRTNTTERGFPTSAQLHTLPGLAVVSTDYQLPGLSPQAAVAVDHLLATRTDKLVEIYQEDDPQDKRSGHRIVYRLVIAGAQLNRQSLGAALAAIGEQYRLTAPVLSALATVPVLIQVYLACQRIGQQPPKEKGTLR